MRHVLRVLCSQLDPADEKLSQTGEKLNLGFRTKQIGFPFPKFVLKGEAFWSHNRFKLVLNTTSSTGAQNSVFFFFF